MENPSDLQVRPGSRRRWRFAWLLLIGAAVFALVIWVSGAKSDARLEALAKRGYPTTLDALETWIPAPPPEENAASLFIEAADGLREPRGKMVPGVGTGDFTPVRGQAWPPEALRDTRAYVADNAKVFEQIPKFIAAKRTRFNVAYTNGANLGLKHLAPLKKLTQALTTQAQLDAEEGRGHAASEALLATVAVCRALDDEPILISKLVQIACEAIGCQAVGRVLNRTALDEADLAALQAAFEGRISSNRLEQAFVGELCLGLDYYRASPKTIATAMDWSTAFSGGTPTATTPQILFWTIYKGSGLHLSDRSAYIGHMEELFDITRRPFAERTGLAGAWSTRVTKECSAWYRPRALCNVALSALSSSIQRDLVGQATLECTVTALAVERYRRAHDGKLPAGVDALVPRFLGAVPTDPFDGKPLRFRPKDGGYVVYSIGEDETDDGGRERARGAASKGSDVTVIVIH